MTKLPRFLSRFVTAEPAQDSSARSFEHRSKDNYYLTHDPRNVFYGLQSFYPSGQHLTDQERDAIAKLTLANQLDAIDVFTKQLASSPDDWLTYLRRGAVFRERGEYSRAIEDFSAVIRLAPNEPTAYNFRGYLLLNANDYVGAISDFARAAVLDRDSYMRYILVIDIVVNAVKTSSLLTNEQLSMLRVPSSIGSIGSEYLHSFGIEADQQDNMTQITYSLPDINVVIASIMRNVPHFHVSAMPLHPGVLIDILLEHTQTPVAKAAEGLEITREQLYRVIRGTSSVSPRLADNLERANIGGRAEEWLFVQSHFDLAQMRLPAKPVAKPRRVPPKVNRP